MKLTKEEIEAARTELEYALKLARRFRVMEEYCEAADAIIFDNNCGVVPHDFFPRRDAYRAMKEERDAE